MQTNNQWLGLGLFSGALNLVFIVYVWFMSEKASTRESFNEVVLLNTRRQLRDHNRTHGHANVLEFPPVRPFSLGQDPESNLYAHLFWEIASGKNKENGNWMLDLPKGNYKLFVDVGLRDLSAYACMLANDPTLVVIGFEADTSLFGRALHRTIELVNNQSLRNRWKFFPLGLSDEKSMMKLNLNYADACASLLPSHPMAWWCAHTTGHMVVPVYRLDSILNMIPKTYEMLYLKVDTEGADLHVLRGAGDYLKRFQYVTAEVANDTIHFSRIGANTVEETVKYVTAAGFKGTYCSHGDCHFSKVDGTAEKEIVEKLHTIGHDIAPKYCTDNANKYKIPYANLLV